MALQGYRQLMNLILPGMSHNDWISQRDVYHKEFGASTVMEKLLTTIIFILLLFQLQIYIYIFYHF